MRMTLFAAMMPALSDRHLQKGYASYARDVRTWNGTLRAFRVPSVGQPCDRDCLSEIPVGASA